MNLSLELKLLQDLNLPLNIYTYIYICNFIHKNYEQPIRSESVIYSPFSSEQQL